MNNKGKHFIKIDALTTGQCAKLCRLGLNTIIRCCDAGLLKSMRLPPSYKHRRIYWRDLRKFMVDHKLDTSALDKLVKENDNGGNDR